MPETLTLQQAKFLEKYLGYKKPPEDSESTPNSEAPYDITSLADWFLDAKATAQKSIERLQKALANIDEPNCQRIASQGLNAVTKGNSTALMKSIHELRSASKESRQDAESHVIDNCGEYRQFLENDPIIALCENNPFAQGIDISSALISALDQIQSEIKSSGLR